MLSAPAGRDRRELGGLMASASVTPASFVQRPLQAGLDLVEVALVREKGCAGGEDQARVCPVPKTVGACREAQVELVGEAGPGDHVRVRSAGGCGGRSPVGATPAGESMPAGMEEGEGSMSFRFWRRIKIAPGLTLNLSKSGGSLSFGPRGAKLTVGPRGTRGTLGLPGTGLFYTTTLSGRRGGTGSGASSQTAATPTVPAEKRLTLGFFKRLITPDDEEAFVDGCRELALGDEKKAYELLRKATHLADGAFVAGFQALRMGRLEEAEKYLWAAAEKHRELGRYFGKYGVAATMSLPITDEISVHAGANLQAVLLGLVELYQRRERWDEAIACLKRLRELEPDDVVVKLSLAEVLLAAHPGGKGACHEVVRLSQGIDNESPVHAALLLYKARALRELGMPAAARDVLRSALRRKKGRSRELLLALRYERMLVYEDLGQRRRARAELERLYAEAPDYADVASRLGL